jgi:hypothetical protein
MRADAVDGRAKRLASRDISRKRIRFVMTADGTQA